MPDLDPTGPSASTLADLARAIRAGKLSPVALTRAYLDRIARLGRQVLLAGQQRLGMGRQVQPIEIGIFAGQGP